MSDHKEQPRSEEEPPAEPAIKKPEYPVLYKAPYDPDEEEEPAPCCNNPHHQHR